LLDIAGISTVESVATQPATAKDELGKEEFLKLFLSQLKAQDPLKPMDSTDFTAQLAQFSSLEQLFNTNETLGNLFELQSTQVELQASSLIGKNVLADGSAVSIKEVGGGTDLNYLMEGDAVSVDVSIYDVSGDLVKTISSAAQGAGRQDTRWDGTDMNGNPVPAGNYSFNVSGIDAMGDKVKAVTMTRGIVERVSFEGDSLYITVNGSSLPMTAIVQIEGG